MMLMVVLVMVGSSIAPHISSLPSRPQPRPQHHCWRLGRRRRRERGGGGGEEEEGKEEEEEWEEEEEGEKEEK